MRDKKQLLLPVILFTCVTQVSSSPSPATVSPTTAPSNTSQEAKCDKLLLITDKCVQRAMLVGQKAAKIPNTAEELVEGHCKRVTKDIPCMRRYAVKCLTPLSRTLFNLGYRTATRLYRRICHTKEGQDEWLRHVKCMQPEQLSVVHKYMDMITMYIEYIADNVTDSEVIPYMCCSYFKVYQDAEKDLHGYCDKLTGPETVDYIMGMVKSMSADMIDMGCGRYASVKACEANFAHGMKVMKDMVTPLSKVKPRQYSPIVPSVRVLKRLDKVVP